MTSERIWLTGDQWIEPATDAWRGWLYYDGVHHGREETKQAALEACQCRYDYARGITGRPKGELVYPATSQAFTQF